MADIAKRAGVHKTTVSLALRNHPSIPQKTRDRLSALAVEMGYRPDPALNALIDYRFRNHRQREAATVAYLTHWNTKLGWRESRSQLGFFNGAAAKAEQLGYLLEPFWLGEEHMTPRRMSDILQARGIRGVIIASQRLARTEELALDWTRLAGVKIDYLPRRPALLNVSNDRRGMIQNIMERITAAGFRRVGFLLDEAWDRLVDRNWSAGFLAEQQALPEADRVPLFMYLDGRYSQLDEQVHPADETLLPRLKAWLDRHQPEVVLGYGGIVFPWLELAGLRVPQDLAFVDIQLETDDGRLAGMRHNSQDVGETAMEVLAAQLRQNRFGVPRLASTTLIEGTWNDGASLPSQKPADRTLEPA